MTPSRRLSRVITATGATLALVVTLVAAGDLYRRYSETIFDAERRTATLAHVVGEHVARTFEAIDRVLQVSASAFNDQIEGQMATPEAVHERINAIHSGSPMLLGLGWTGRDGRRVAGTTAAPVVWTTVAAAEPLAIHQNDRNAGLFISHPSRVGPMSPWLINVSRRVEGRDGT